jgi:hypothetical protein
VPSEPRSHRFERTFDAAVFAKGNLHAHTNDSDGDSPPEDVIAWYREHGYAFLAITDHNRLTLAASHPELQDASFSLLSGEEVSMWVSGKQVHVNALCTRRGIGGGNFSTAAEALSWATTRIASEGGVAVVNHPNFDRAVAANDLLAAGSASLIEIMSGHPYVYSAGRGDRPSHEALWDFALGAGAHIMGVAVDDLHRLRVDADPPAYPGSGWIETFGEQHDASSVCDALRRGRLYASTGPSLRRISVTETTYTVWPREGGTTVRFIGRGGRILETRGPLAEGEPGSHVLGADDGYVRATITDPANKTAWTPAVFEAP